MPKVRAIKIGFMMKDEDDWYCLQSVDDDNLYVGGEEGTLVSRGDAWTFETGDEYKEALDAAKHLGYEVV